MPEIRGTVEIGRPVEDVFAYLSDPTNNPKWESSAVEMELTTEGPLALGSKGRRVEKIPGMGTDEGIWEITKHVPNESLAMTFESQRVTGSSGYELEAAEGATSLTYWFVANPRNMLMKLLLPLMIPMIRGQVRKDYVELKRILESSA